MNGRIFKLDIPAHQAVQELLPWFAAAQLDEEDTARVEAHLQSCAQCQQDLQWERNMRASFAAAASAPGADSELDADRALARLLPQLGAQDMVAPANASAQDAGGSAPSAPAVQTAADAGQGAASGAQPLPWWRKAAANQSTWLRWAAVAQCVIIAGLLVLLARPDSAPTEYRAMGAADAPAGASAANLVVQFQPETSEHALRAALQAQDARIVDGPTVTGAWLLAVPPATRDQALQALRADPSVKLAESIDKGGAQ
jgi:hypothetical protein